MKALVQTYPPLGQVTTIQNGEVQFTSILEVSNSRVEEDWDVALWISLDKGDWSEIRLAKVKHGDEPQVLCGPSQSSSFLYFSTSLLLHQSAHFTVKFRDTSKKPWNWARDEEGLNDGVIIVSPAHAAASDDLKLCIPDLNPAWKVSSRVSQSPGTQLWSLDCSLSACPGNASTFRDVEIGSPWGSFLRWFALVRHKSAWLGPRHGKHRFSVDQDAILCCFLSHSGKTMALLAVSGIRNVTSTFQHTSKGMVSIRARNDAESPGTVTVLVSEGIDFDCAVASVMYHARTMVSQRNQVSEILANGGQQSGNSAMAGWKPEWYDGLGFCTWNALGQQLSEKRVIDAVQKLAADKIHITNLIIDDNWQSLDRNGSDQSQYGWSEFEADRKAFPNGLRGMVRQIRNLHPDIQHVLVWHALLGYWGGIAPESHIAQTYNTIKVAQEGESGQSLTVVGKEDVSRLYDDFYKFLADSGIDGVKADAQVMIDLLKAAPDRRGLMSTYLDAWSTASERYFGAKTISCMSQFPHALFYSQLPRSRREILVRNSDDFFPNVPQSHPWHIWANAHNAIITQYLNAVPDWDMFQTGHDYSELHAAARCISGGPIYITDTPGDHNKDLISQMTATTPLGQTIILRPSMLGRSISAYSGYEDESLLKIGSYNGSSQTGTGILGLFNVSARHLTELLHLDFFPGVVSSGKYVVRAHTTGKTSQPMSLGTPESLIATSIPEGEYEILCAFPVTPFKSRGNEVGHVGVLGLVGKMTGCAAITASSVIQRLDGRVVISGSLKALGTMGVYISNLPHLNIEHEFMVAIQDQPVPFETVNRCETDDRVFEIDVEKAWEQMGLSALQRGDVQVKVSFQP